MRIFGGKDFYDCGLSMGIDPTITLVRKEEDAIPVEEAGGTLMFSRIVGEPDHTVTNVAVAFCGTTYHGILMPSEGPLWQGIWSADAARKKEEIYRSKNSSMKNFRFVVEPRLSRRKARSLEEHFAPHPSRDDIQRYMIDRKISIMVEEDPTRDYYPRQFFLNPPTLKKIDFAKAVDPYTAFQELSMWISGVLGGTSPDVVKIKDDKIIAESHGFDKFSFRGPRLKC